MPRIASRASRATFTAAAVVAAAVATAPAAFAADAPTRIVDFNEAGQRAGGSVVAVAPGATEAILLQPDSTAQGAPTSIVVRDIAAGKTTKLLPSSVRFEDASDDTKRLLVTTTGSFDPADINGAADLYVYDRTTSRATLVSKTTSGAPTGNGWNLTTTISGDGKVVYFGASGAPLRRVAVDTGAVTEYAGSALGAGATDRTGATVLTKNGILRNGTLVPNPSNANLASLTAPAFADNGSVLVSLQGNPGAGSLQVTDTTSGGSKTVALPSWVQREYPTLLDVNADGSKALLAISLNRGGSIGTRLVLGTVDLASGAVAQVGNDLPWNGNRWAAPTPDWAFAGAGTVVAQLGASPIPGSDVVAPQIPPRPAIEYTALNKGCRANNLQWPPVPARRPSLYLVANAVGTSPQVPAKADFTVTKTSTGVVTNRFTLTPGATRDINTGYGDFTYAVKVTFKDGTSVSGSKSVPSYTAPLCPAIGLF